MCWWLQFRDFTVVMIQWLNCIFLSYNMLISFGYHKTISIYSVNLQNKVYCSRVLLDTVLFLNLWTFFVCNWTSYNSPNYPAKLCWTGLQRVSLICWTIPIVLLLKLLNNVFHKQLYGSCYVVIIWPKIYSTIA